MNHGPAAKAERAVLPHAAIETFKANLGEANRIEMDASEFVIHRLN